MSEKKVTVIYKKEGVILTTEGLSNDERQVVQDDFDNGERDPGKLRESMSAR
jgi:hypothetical protein